MNTDEHQHQHRSRPTSIEPIVLTARPFSDSDFIHSRDLPPPYTEERFVLGHSTGPTLSTIVNNHHRTSYDESDIESTNPTATTTINTPITATTSSSTSSSLYRIGKRQVPIHTLRNRMRQFISGSAVRTSADGLNHPMYPRTTISSTADIHLEPTMPIASIDDDEQQSSEDDKMLTP
jgi:hypothetical protein